MNSKDEKLLREFVKKTFVAKMFREEKEKFLQEQKVRSWVRTLISESQEETTNTVIFEAKEQTNPHPNTGINKLRDSIRKAKPSIKTKFQQLTSSSEQRDSFVNHLLAAFVRLFDQLDALSASTDELEMDSEVGSLETGGTPQPELSAPPEGTDIESDLEDELDIQLENVLREIDIDLEDADDNDVVSDELEAEKEQSKQLSQVEKDVEKKKSKDSARAEFSSGLEGDSTGRNQAFDAFNLVQSYFSDNYLDLDSPEDQDMFKKWGLYNLKLLLTSYEEELNPGLETPNIENPT